MKSKYIAIVAAVLFMATFAFAGANGQQVLPLAQGVGVSKLVSTYANSQIDTVVITRESGVSAISFAVHAKDSVFFGTTAAAVVRRVVDGTLMPAITGDTLQFTAIQSTTDGNTSTLAFGNGTSYTRALTLAPLADQYIVILKYHSSGNGVTSPTIVYEAIKQYQTK
jgi:hypothetical protein